MRSELVSATHPPPRGRCPSVLFSPVQHRSPMMTSTTPSASMSSSVFDRMARIAPRPEAAFVCELKIDGWPCPSLRDGRLLQRDRGMAGPGRRHRQRATIGAVPTSLVAEGRGRGRRARVRGEVYIRCRRSSAQPAPARRRAQDLRNPRNSAAARCGRRTRRSPPRASCRSGIQLGAWTEGPPSPVTATAQLLRQCGLPVDPMWRSCTAPRRRNVCRRWRTPPRPRLRDRRVVIKVDDLDLQRRWVTPGAALGDRL